MLTYKIEYIVRIFGKDPKYISDKIIWNKTFLRKHVFTLKSLPTDKLYNVDERLVPAYP